MDYIGVGGGEAQQKGLSQWHNFEYCTLHQGCRGIYITVSLLLCMPWKTLLFQDVSQKRREEEGSKRWDKNEISLGLGYFIEVSWLAGPTLSCSAAQPRASAIRIPRYFSCWDVTLLYSLSIPSSWLHPESAHMIRASRRFGGTRCMQRTWPLQWHAPPPHISLPFLCSAPSPHSFALYPLTPFLHQAKLPLSRFWGGVCLSLHSLCTSPRLLLLISSCFFCPVVCLSLSLLARFVPSPGSTATFPQLALTLC